MQIVSPSTAAFGQIKLITNHSEKIHLFGSTFGERRVFVQNLFMKSNNNTFFTAALQVRVFYKAIVEHEVLASDELEKMFSGLGINIHA